jgi:methyl-accepting chemotaxis protein
MLSQLSMSKKLLLTLLPLVFLILLALLLFTRYTVQQAVTEQAMTNARALAQAEGDRQLEGLMNELAGVEALTGVFRTRSQFPPLMQRDYFNQILRTHLEQRPHLLGAWSVWEPNALDNLDAFYVNAEGHDATGRYVVLWFRDEAGIQVEANVAL